MNFILWIARRLRINGGDRANSIGLVIAVAGVALAVVVMATTLAITSGFKQQIVQRVMGFEPQVSVLPAYDYDSGASDATITSSPALLAAIDSTAPGTSAALRFTMPAILKTDTDYAGVYLQGHGKGHDFTFEKESTEEGAFPNFTTEENANSIVVSRDIASALQLGAGDKVYAYFFVDGAIKARRFTIAAIYSTGFSDYDKITAFAPLHTLQKVAGADSAQATRLALTLPPGRDIEQTAYDLQMTLLQMYQQQEMPLLYPVDNVKHTGASFFNWLQLLDTNVVVIFILMACVAGFTLISSMFILVLDRIPTIGLLRALGAPKTQIRGIFATLAMKTVALGILIGNALALGLLMAQQHYHLLKLDPQMYYLPYVPVHINPCQMVVLNLAVALVAWALLLIPSQVAARTSPARTMRYE